MSDKTLEATEYVRRNGAIILRQALPRNDPESWESLWKNKFGSMASFPYSSLYGVEPLIRLSRETLKELLDYHDKNPKMSVEDILNNLDIEIDFSEYGS